MPEQATTLHIRCGRDLADALPAAGFDGDYLEFSDPVNAGPLPAVINVSSAEQEGQAFLDKRAAYLAETFEQDITEVKARLLEEAQGLRESARYDKIVLWFEHDSYDQLILIRLLAWYFRLPDSWSRLYLMSIDRFEGVEPFHGFGNLSPAQLASLEGQEKKLTLHQLNFGHKAWQAYCEHRLDDLWALSQKPNCPLPFFPRALKRHCQESPWLSDGLNLSQRLALQALDRGASTPVDVFKAVCASDPLPFQGDLMFWPQLRVLSEGDAPAITGFEDLKDPIALTDTGRALLAGEQAWEPGNGKNWWWDNSKERPVKLEQAGRC